MRCVVTERHPPRLRAQQAMQRARLPGNGVGDVGVQTAGGEIGTDHAVDRFAQPRRSASGGRGQRDPRRRRVAQARRLHLQREQPRHRGGLAGTGAAGDQQQATTQRHRRGQGLTVEIVVCRRVIAQEQTAQRGRQRGRVIDAGRELRASMQRFRQGLFVARITSQRDASVREREQCARVACVLGMRDAGAGVERSGPFVHVRQLRAGAQRLQQSVRIVQGETAVAQRHRAHRQRAGQRDRRRCAQAVAQQRGEVDIDPAQCAFGLQAQQRARGDGIGMGRGQAAAHRRSSVAPSNSASSADSRAGDTGSICTPLREAPASIPSSSRRSIPLKNRYTAPPRSRASS